MKLPLISVVVTVYNFESWIRQAVQSILDQKGPFDLEIVVIDDASTDGSVEVLNSFTDPRVKLIRHPENKGPNFSVNEGFSLVKGEFIARLDGDDAYEPDFFAKALLAFQAEPGAGFLYGDFKTMDSTGRVTNPHARPARPPGPGIRNEFRYILENYYINAPTLIGRREAWEKALPVPPEFSFLDWYMSLSMSLGFSAIYLPEVLASYRIHNAGMHRTMIRDRRGEQITRMVLNRFIPAGLQNGLITHSDRSVILSANYRTLALKYFGSGMMKEAAVCFRDAVSARPSLLLSPGFLKYFAGSHFPGIYRLLKRAGGRQA
ncbi:MAG: glycosyltransferase [Bacteroidetes bacterium]|nr:glycosyltransferase [Bacteroidota bacterium]